MNRSDGGDCPLRWKKQQDHKDKDALAIDHAFDSLDCIDHDGVLSKEEIRTFMKAATDSIHLKANQQVIDTAVDALLEDVATAEEKLRKTHKAMKTLLYSTPTCRSIDKPPKKPEDQDKDDDEEEPSMIIPHQITRQQFHQLFYRHPSMIQVLETSTRSMEDDHDSCAISVTTTADASTSMNGSNPDNSHCHYQHSNDDDSQYEYDDYEQKGDFWQEEEYFDDEDLEQSSQPKKKTASSWFMTQWRNRGVAMVWLFLYLALNVAAFAYKAMIYVHHDRAQAVFGQCIVIARGSAQCLNLNCMLVLLPVSKHLLTRLRLTYRLRFWFPFDAVREAHIVIGFAIVFFTITHVGGHICDFIRFADADEHDILNLLSHKHLPEDAIPDGRLERWVYLLEQIPAWTGVIMVVFLIIALSTIRMHKNRFHTTWLTHQLLLVMIVPLLCLHGTASLLEPYQTVYWVAIPFLLYFAPRVYRETRCAICPVQEVALKKGDVIMLRLKKPTSWNRYVQSGMYAVINIPSVSRSEWHPFTLTSAPKDDYIEFHFRKVGDWTSKVHQMIKAKQASNFVVKVDGPVGASSQGYSDYPVVVLVGAGIGVTPFVSVVKQLLAHPGRVQRLYLYWTVRDREAFEWFGSLTEDVYRQDKRHVLQVKPFLTSVKPNQGEENNNNNNLGSALFRHATTAKHNHSDYDLVIGQHTPHMVQFGRPDWEEELLGVRERAKLLGSSRCGVFLCGPKPLANVLRNVTFRLSKSDPTGFHFHFTKETF